MTRIFVAVLVAVLLLATPLAADQMLQNDDLTPADAADDDQQQQFAESTTTFLDVAPLAILVLAVGAALGGARILAGRSI